MNYWILGGVILIAVGTISLTWGAHVASRALGQEDRHALEAKIDETLDEVRGVAQGADPPTQAALKQVEREFREWADEFLSNRERRAVEFRELVHGDPEDAFRFSDQIRPVVDEIAGTLRGLAAAYTSTSGDSVQAVVPRSPENFFTTQYEAHLRFTDHVFWYLGVDAGGDVIRPPAIFLQFGIPSVDEARRFSDDMLWIIPRSERFDLIPSGRTVSSLIDDRSWPLTGFEDEVRTVFKRLFEAQLHLLREGDGG